MVTSPLNICNSNIKTCTFLTNWADLITPKHWLQTVSKTTVGDELKIKLYPDTNFIHTQLTDKSCLCEGYNVLFLMMLVQLHGRLSAGCGLWSCCWVFLLLINVSLFQQAVLNNWQPRAYYCHHHRYSWLASVSQKSIWVWYKNKQYTNRPVRLCATLCVTISWLPVANTLELYSPLTLGLYCISVQ